MRKFKSLFDYALILKHALVFLAFCCINKLSNNVAPFSNALLGSMILIKSNPFASCFLYLLSFLFLGEFGLLTHGLFSSIFFVIIYYIYKKFNVKSKIEFTFYTAFSLILYIFLGNTSNYLDFVERLIISLITVILSYFLSISLFAIEKKGLKYKLTNEEIISISIFYVCLSLGLSNLTSPLIYKGFSFLILLLLSFTLDNGKGALLSIILGVPLAIYYSNINFISLYACLGIFALCFKNISKYLMGFSILIFEYILQFLFKIYAIYDYMTILSGVIGIVIFSLIPLSVLSSLKEKLDVFKEKALVKQTINRNRTYLSNKLYELSGVFSEMSYAFNNFNKSQISEETAKETLVKKIYTEICTNCPFREKCLGKEETVLSGISKLSDIGFAKGKLSLIDIPKELINLCIRPNDVIFSMNKFLADYRIISIDNINLNNGREMLKNEAEGLSEILKSLALESGSTLKYHSKIEKFLSDNLTKKGFIANEILIYGNDKNLTVTLILSMKEFSIHSLTNIISKTLGFKIELNEKVNISEEKIYLSFTKATNYDAVFGISKVSKDDHNVSGDTYSVTKINKNKFLVALSDGMGSGKKAEEISSVSLSLIESFYKAGMKSENILSTVNKLLSLYTDDSFTALDVCVIDLENSSADFIKYGSPYGFIVNDNGVRIIEGNSLPLGILKELKPSVCSDKLNDGDIVLLISDGISDAFGSSSDLIEFLRKIPAKNPQTLTDRILNKALENINQIKNDDMTAVAVRIFKK